MSRARRPAIERLMEKVVWNGDEDECWTWEGAMTSNGYGHTQGASGYMNAHRLSHLVFLGPVPEGAYVLHSCDNPRCVNPAHLRAGTPQENVREREERRTHAPGRRFDAATVRQIRALHKAGWTQHKLAIEFDSAQGVINRLVRRESYRSIE